MPEEGKKNVREQNLHAGHRGRMRERFQNGGLSNFHSHETVELLLFDFIPVVNTNPIAHRLIERFGTVMGVLTAPYEELVKVQGVGPKTAEGIRSVMERMSQNICEKFREAAPLMKYDIAFLADWFLCRDAGSMGMIVCGHDRRFRDYVTLDVQRDDLLFDLGRQIVKQAKSQAYYLLVREDYSLLPAETARMLRIITGQGKAYMIDAFVLDGYKPVSILYL